MIYFASALLLVFTQIVMLRGNAVDTSCGAVPMLAWSGRESRRVLPLPLPVDVVIVQHTVTKECLTDAECEEVSRQIQTYHTNYMNWTDIGQSFLIGGNGMVYEGAGWMVGAHTRGYNNKSIGVAFIGDFRSKLPTSAAIKAAQYFLECGALNERLSRHYRLIAHSQVSTTVSPGAKLCEEIRSWPHWVDNDTELDDRLLA